jgi:large repetitive protein
MSSRTTIFSHCNRQTGGRSLSALVMVLACASSAHADITNTATATATYNAAPVSGNSSTVNIPVTAAIESLSVSKLADDTSDVVAGQVITYSYVVTNTGNRSLTNINLTDVANGSGPDPVPLGETLTDVPPLNNPFDPPNNSTDATANDGIWSKLQPGDSITFTATYTVTQADVDNRQ